MAVLPTRDGFAMAVVDPWDVRATTVVRAPNASDRDLAFSAALTRERPTVLVAATGRISHIARTLADLARNRGVEVVAAPPAPAVRAHARRLRSLCPAAALAGTPKAAREALALALATLHALPLRTTTHGHDRTRSTPVPHRRRK